MEIIKLLLFTSLAIFAPVQALVITVGVLIFADLALGIWAALKRGESITSAALRRTVTKMFVYQVAILTGFLLETYLIGGILPIAKLVAGACGSVEFKSILENASEITGVSFKDVILKLGSKNDLDNNKK